MNNLAWLVWLWMFLPFVFAIGYGDILLQRRRLRKQAQDEERHHSP